MNYFIIYTAEGQITRRGFAPDDQIPYQLTADEAFLIGETDSDLYYVNIPDDEEEEATIVAMPPRPSEFHIFDHRYREWRDLRVLDEIKLAKWEVIKAARDAAELSYFIYEGHRYDCDAVSFKRIMGAVSLAHIALTTGSPYSQDWTTADNVVVQLDGMQMIQLGVALGTFVDNLHAYGRALREALAAATSVEEVNEINWYESALRAA